MLPLESSRWLSLSHAYGDAANVPKMIRELQHESARVRTQAWDAV